MTTHSRGSSFAGAGKLVVSYCALAMVWIVASDWLVARLVSDPAELFFISTAKGLGFVAVSGVVMFFLARRELERRTLAEARLGTAQATFRLLVERLPTSFYAAAVENRAVRYLSPSSKAVFGKYFEGELRDGGLLIHCLHPEDRVRVGETLATALADRAPFQLEYRLVNAQGVVRWVRDEGTVLRDSADTPVEFVGTLTDITAAKEVEQHLRRNEAELTASRTLLQKTLSSLDVAVLVVDSHARVVRECNATAERMFGRSRPELLGHTLLPLYLDAEQFTRVGRELEETYEWQSSYHTETMLRRASGEPFPAELSARQVLILLSFQDETINPRPTCDAPQPF